MKNPTFFPKRPPLAPLLVILALIAGAAVAGQDSRRRSQEMASSQESFKSTDIEAEVKFGRDVAARLLARHPYNNNEKLNRYLNLLGRGLALNASRPELDYRFALVKSDTVNAYATPGGFIFITTAAFEQMQDEAELAAVIAHEIAHVTERHIVKALNIRGHDESSEGALARVIGGASDPTRIALGQALDKAMELLFDKGLQKQDEFDADRLAVLLLANSGYDPKALSRYLARIKSLHGEGTRVVNSTHPPFDERLSHLTHALDAEGLAQLNYPTAKKRFSDYAKQK